MSGKPEGVERMWAAFRWRNGRLEWRRGTPPGVLVLACRIGLHFMAWDIMRDAYACRCGRQQLLFEEVRS